MPENIHERIQQGLECLKNSEWQSAEKNFRNILRIREVPYIRTKLAMACYMQGKYEEAWKALQPNLTAEVMEPYARAWAAELCRHESLIPEARKYLKDGIRQYEWGTTNIAAMGISPEIWHYAAVVLKKVAGTLDDHELVLDLHYRWTSYPPFLEDYYLAGVAHFNLYQYHHAVAVWGEFRHEDFSPGEVLIAGTRLVQSGAIPHFPLEYSLPSYSPYLKEGQPSVEQLAKGGVVRLLTIGSLFRDPAFVVEQGELIRLLVNIGGSWGLALARSVMETRYPGITETVKLAALYGLVDRGVCGTEQPALKVLDGEQQTAMAEEEAGEGVSKIDPAVLLVLRRAENLLEQEKYEEAIQLLEPLIVVHFRSVELLQSYGRALALNKDFEEAMEVAESIMNLDRNNPVYTMLAVLLAVQAQDLETADEYLKRIQYAELPEDLREMYIYMKEVVLELAYLSQGLSHAANKLMLEQQLDKVLPKGRTLKGLLRTLPVEWLDSIYLHYDLPAAGRRSQRERILADYLLAAPVNVLIDGLSKEALELLHYLVDKQGFSTMGPITRKFGSFKKENYFEVGEKPETVIGELVVHGLVFVGTMDMDGRSFKSAVIPRELVERFTHLKKGSYE